MVDVRQVTAQRPIAAEMVLRLASQFDALAVQRAPTAPPRGRVLKTDIAGTTGLLVGKVHTCPENPALLYSAEFP